LFKSSLWNSYSSIISISFVDVNILDLLIASIYGILVFLILILLSNSDIYFYSFFSLDPFMSPLLLEVYLPLIIISPAIFDLCLSYKLCCSEFYIIWEFFIWDSPINSSYIRSSSMHFNIILSSIDFTSISKLWFKIGCFPPSLITLLLYYLCVSELMITI